MDVDAFAGAWHGLPAQHERGIPNDTTIYSLSRKKFT